MPISTFTICPGGDNLPPEDVASQLVLERARAHLHGVYVTGLCNLSISLKTMEKYKYLSEPTTDPVKLAMIAAVHSTDPDPELGLESIGGFIQVISNTLSAVTVFISELLKKLTEFFGRLYDRTKLNSQVTQGNIRLMEQTISKSPELRKKFSVIEIEPACDFSFYDTFAKNTMYLCKNVNKFTNIDTAQATAQAILTQLDRPTQQVTSSKIDASTAFKDPIFLEAAEAIGLKFPNINQHDPDPEKALHGVVFGSTFKDKLSVTNKATLENLGYSPEALTTICNEYVIPLEKLANDTASRLDALSGIQKMCEIKLTQLRKNPKFMENLQSGDHIYEQVRQLTVMVSNISSYMVLQTKLAVAVDEIIAYHKILTTAVKLGV